MPTPIQISKSMLKVSLCLATLSPQLYASYISHTWPGITMLALYAVRWGSMRSQIILMRLEKYCLLFPGLTALQERVLELNTQCHQTTSPKLQHFLNSLIFDLILEIIIHHSFFSYFNRTSIIAVKTYYRISRLYVSPGYKSHQP